MRCHDAVLQSQRSTLFKSIELENWSGASTKAAPELTMYVIETIGRDGQI
jgi:hypothetical protein